MKRGKSKDFRTTTAVLLAVLCANTAGCTDALDAAAGGLNFIQNSVTTMLTSMVFPDSEMSINGSPMGGVMGSGGGGHEGHGG